MKNSMFLVEVYDNFNNLFKRRIAANIGDIELWVENHSEQWAAYNDGVKLILDDYGCGEIVYDHNDYERTILFTIKTTNIAML